MQVTTTGQDFPGGHQALAPAFLEKDAFQLKEQPN